jgi:hypothetical protein
MRSDFAWVWLTSCSMWDVIAGWMELRNLFITNIYQSMGELVKWENQTETRQVN